MKTKPLISAFLVSSCLVLGFGCSPSGTGTQPKATSESAPDDSASASVEMAGEDHGHKPGAHGGFIVSIGADSYHAEVIVESGGALRLLTLGRDESRIQEVESQNLTAFVKATGDSDATQVQLTPQPQDGDGAGKTSQFCGNLPADLVGQELEITIPNLRISGERFRLGFSTAATSEQDSAMPGGVSAAEEEALYLTAGGAYTEADIAANGNVTPSVKFKGVQSAHDMHPKAGDKICPITQTKANPKFTWIVGGKPYEFCCPPCIDEFVKLAKEQSQALEPPETFVK